MTVENAGSDRPDEPSVAIASFPAFYETNYRAMVRLAAALVGRWDVAEGTGARRVSGVAWTLGAVRTHLRRARRSLATRLELEDGEE